MIEKFYSSLRKPVVHKAPLVIQHTAKWVGGPPSALTEEQRAAKKGLSITEYRRRIGLVARAQIGLALSIGDTVWPVKNADAIEHGQCMVRAICRHYDDYGDAEWNENPFILAVSPMKDRNHVINCTGNWVTRTAPEIVLGDC